MIISYYPLDFFRAFDISTRGSWQGATLVHVGKSVGHQRVVWSFVAGDPPLPESPNFMGTPPHEAYPDAHSPGHQSSGPFPRGLVWLFNTG